MIKELIASIIIVIAVFSLDIFTQNYTRQTSSEIAEYFTDLKEAILNEDKNQIEGKLKKLNDAWDEKYKKLAYYIEHGDLEKVNTAIVNMKSYVETEEYSSAIAFLEEAKFIVDHIEEKKSFNLQNIF